MLVQAGLHGGQVDVLVVPHGVAVVVKEGVRLLVYETGEQVYGVP